MQSVPSTGMYPGACTWPGSRYSWSGAWFPDWDAYIEDYLEGILLLDVAVGGAGHNSITRVSRSANALG
jgi:hypothetical protein